MNQIEQKVFLIHSQNIEQVQNKSLDTHFSPEKSNNDLKEETKYNMEDEEILKFSKENSGSKIIESTNKFTSKGMSSMESKEEFFIKVPGKKLYINLLETEIGTIGNTAEKFKGEFEYDEADILSQEEEEEGVIFS